MALLLPSATARVLLWLPAPEALDPVIPVARWMGSQFLVAALVLTAAVASVACLIADVVQRWRHADRHGRMLGRALSCLIVAVLAAAVFFGQLMIAQWRIKAIAERARPIVRALHAYRDEHKQFPPDLRALTPAFLPELPDTGVMVSRRYKYARFPKGATVLYKITVDLDLDPPLIPDILIYLPTGSYASDAMLVDVSYGRWAIGRASD